MLGPLFLARPLARQFSFLAADPMPAQMRGAAWVPAAAGLLLLVAGTVAARQEIAPAANITPENAIKSFAFSNARPILNDYAFGGYLDFVGIPPFIDGRGELYGAAFTPAPKTNNAQPAVFLH